MKEEKEVQTENIEVVEEINKSKEAESQFDILEITKDAKITVLNINGGCIVNTYFKDSVASVFVPNNHLRNGEIGPM